MDSRAFACFCAFFANGCFTAADVPTPADTDTDTASDGTESDSLGTGSAVTSVTNGMTTGPSSTSPTQPTDPSDTITTGPDTDSQTGTTGDVEPQCGDGVAVATEFCFDDPPLNYEVGPGAVDIAIGDITANGLLDIVILHADADMGSISVLEADGVGGFVMGTTQAAPGYGGRVRVADVDGDGDGDVFALGRDGLRYYRNEVAFFLDYDAPQFFGSEVAELIVADVDGDDVPDVLASESYSHIWLRGVMNMGDWAFGMAYTQFPTTGEGASGIIAGTFSFDGDADLDVVGLNQYYSTVEVLTNDGNGNYAAHSTPSLCSGSDGVRFGDWSDLDGDGNSDLVSTCMGGDIGVSLDDGSGTFATFDTLALAGAHRPTVVDLDGDEHPDLLVTSTTLNRAVVFRNDGSGGFALGDPQFMADAPVHSAAAADLDGDGAMDVIVASNDSPMSRVDVYFANP
jgi:hypothetical protein